MVKIPDIPPVFNQAEYLVDRHLAEGRGGKTAIYFEKEIISYAKMSEQVNRTGNVFKNLGAEIENRIIIILPDCPEMFYCYLGAMKIGAVPVPVSTLASSSEYLHLLNDSRAKLTVVSADILPKIQAIRDELQYLKHIICIEDAPDTYHFQTLVTAASPLLEPAKTSKDDMAFWMYTSGTTGAPKGVIHLHHDLLYYWPPFCEDVLRATEDDIIFVSSKMFFSYGRNCSLELPLLYGASVVLFKDWPKPPEILQTIERYRPTLFFSVPSFYSALLREVDSSPRKYNISSLRLCVSAGEALPKHIYDKWMSRFNIPILDGLGSTDVGGIYISNKPGAVKPGSSGQALNGFEWKLVNEQRQEVKTGEIGTLWLKNDGIAASYWHQHSRNKEVFHGEWFITGDQFYRDADGFFWYQSREDDMMKISGQWVSPLEIEGILLEHPSVRECGVICLPDSSGLMKIAAAVVIDTARPAPEHLEEELAGMVRERLAHFKTPRVFHFLKELPRTSTGKLRRQALRQQL